MVHLFEIGDSIPNWLIFESLPSIETVFPAYKKFCGKNPAELDNLIGEIAELNENLVELNKLDEFVNKNVDQKWLSIFKNSNLINIKKLVSILLSIFSSNAYCESIFSIVKNIKSDERNRIGLKLLNSNLAVKCNAEFDCLKAYDLFLSNDLLLKQAKSVEKYDFK